MKPDAPESLEDVEVILWDGDAEDIMALAGLDIEYSHGKDSFSARYGRSLSRACGSHDDPNCVRLLGNQHHFIDSVFARILQQDHLDTQGIALTMIVTDRDYPNGWDGHFCIDGEVFDAQIPYLTPAPEHPFRVFYVEGIHQFESEIVVFKTTQLTID